MSNRRDSTSPRPGGIPRGLEVLVKKAAVDAGFRALLLERRSAAAAEIGLPLTPAERAMLETVPRGQLEAIIARTDVPAWSVPAFLGKVAAAMLATLGVVTVVEAQPVAKGVRPMPPIVQTAPEEPPATATASAPQPPGGVILLPPVRMAGLMADVPPPPATTPATATAPTTTQASQPAREDVVALVAQLDSDDFKTREAAQARLAGMMPGVGPLLEEIQTQQTLSPEQKMRLARVLRPVRPEPPQNVQQRAARAIDR